MRSDPPEVFELGAIDAALATAGFGLREASLGLGLWGLFCFVGVGSEPRVG